MSATALPSEPCGMDPRRLIEAAANNKLQQSGYYAVRRVSCAFDGNVLKLRGRVPSYYEKQIAQSLVLQQLERPTLFENQLVVATGVVTG